MRRSHIKQYPITAFSAAGGQAAAIDFKGELRGAGSVHAGLHIDASVARKGISSLCHDRRVVDVQGSTACSAFDINSVIRTRNFQASIREASVP